MHEDCNEEYDLGWIDDKFLDLQDGEQPPHLDEAADQEELERLLGMVLLWITMWRLLRP